MQMSLVVVEPKINLKPKIKFKKRPKINYSSLGGKIKGLWKMLSFMKKILNRKNKNK